jgi:putative endonuclease
MERYVYILKSLIADKHYIGRATDLDEQLPFENRTGKGYTVRYRPWKLIWLHMCKSMEEAIRI